MPGVDLIMAALLTIAGICLVVYGAGFADPRPYRARWAQGRK